MTPEKRSLDGLLNVVRNNPPVTPLVGDDEIEEILARAPEPRPYGSLDDHKPNRRIQMGTIAALMLAAAGTIMLTMQDDITQRSETLPGAVNPSHARDMAALRRPDTPAVAPTTTPTATPAPTPAVEPAGQGAGARTARVGKRKQKNPLTGTQEVRVGHRPMMSSSATVEVPPPQGTEGWGAPIHPYKEREPNPMLPYRLTIMTSDEVTDRHDPEKDISGTRYIELTVQEAKRIGIYRNNGVLELYGEERREITEWVRAGKLPGYDTSRSEAIVRFRAAIDTNLADLGAVPNPTPDNYSSVAPIVIETQYISSANKLYRAMIYFNRSPLLNGHGGGLSDEEMDLLGGFPNDAHDVREITASPSLNRLVAVHVLPDEGQIRGDGGRTADVHLWYLPTREFIDLLPDRYRQSLRTEVETIVSVQREKLPPGAVCERLTGEPTFLDVCRSSSSGALHDLSVAPNPAHEQITVSFRATEPRTVSISLHDMRGRFLRTLFESVEPGDMANRYTIGLDGVESGAYLVVVKSERGEQVVQRLIVR